MYIYIYMYIYMCIYMCVCIYIYIVFHYFSSMFSSFLVKSGLENVVRNRPYQRHLTNQAAQAVRIHHYRMQ